VTETISLTINDAARLCGLGRTTIYQAIGAGKLDARKSGNRTLIPADSLRKFIENLPPADIGGSRKVALARKATSL